MKKIYLPILMFILFLSSCTNLMNQERKASVSLSFRYMDSSYDDSTITLTVKEKDRIIAAVSEKIDLSSLPIKLKIKDLEPNIEITVTAQIKKEIDGQETILYQNTSSPLKIDIGENPLTLVLNQSTPKVIVKPSFAEIDRNAMVDCVFNAYFGDVKQSVVIKDKTSVVELAFFALPAQSYEVRGEILNSEDKLLYEFKPSAVEIPELESNPVTTVELTLPKVPHVLWSNYADDSDQSAVKEPTWGIFEDVYSSIQTTVSKPDIYDFTIDENNTIWTLELRSLNKHIKDIEPEEVVLTSLDVYERTKIATFFDTDSNNYVLIHSSDVRVDPVSGSDTANSIRIRAVGSSEIPLDCTSQVDDTGAMDIRAMEMYQGDLYIGQRIETSNVSTSHHPEIKVIRNIKSYITEPSKPVEFEVLFNKSSYVDGNNNYTTENTYISDIQIIDNVLYGLVLAEKGSRGGLIKIDLTTKEVTPYFFDVGTVPLNEEYTIKDTDTTKYFVGPRKFIAIKPKKLIIADDGQYEDTGSNKVAYNRIVTVDIENLSSFDSLQLHNVTFSGHVNNSGFYTVED